MPLLQEIEVKDANLKKYETFLATRPATMETNLLETIAELIKKYKLNFFIINIFKITK